MGIATSTTTCQLPHCTNPVHHPGDPESLLCGTCLGLEDDDGRPTWPQQQHLFPTPEQLAASPTGTPTLDALFEAAGIEPDYLTMTGFDQFDVDLEALDELYPNIRRKVCTGCGVNWPATLDFYHRRFKYKGETKQEKESNGLQSRCKRCRREYDRNREGYGFSRSDEHIKTPGGVQLSVCHKCKMRLKPWENYVCGKCHGELMGVGKKVLVVGSHSKDPGWTEKLKSKKVKAPSPGVVELVDPGKETASTGRREYRRLTKKHKAVIREMLREGHYNGDIIQRIGWESSTVRTAIAQARIDLGMAVKRKARSDRKGEGRV